MEDNRIARLIISPIIGQEIVELESRLQERTTLMGKYSIQISRLNFSSKMKTIRGEYKNSIIGIQRARFTKDILRFYDYLGEQYIKTEPNRKQGLECIVTPAHYYHLLPGV